MTRFFEESAGVASSSRLIAAGFCGSALLLAVAAAWVAVRGDANGAGVIAALGAPMTALAGGAWGALRERSDA